MKKKEKGRIRCLVFGIEDQKKGLWAVQEEEKEKKEEEERIRFDVGLIPNHRQEKDRGQGRWEASQRNGNREWSQKSFER